MSAGVGTRTFSVTPTMVAERVEDDAGGARRVAIPELRQRGKEIRVWSPRAAPDSSVAWMEDVGEHMRTSVPPIPSHILNGPPTQQQVDIRFASKAKDERIQIFNVALDEYQQWNTRLWDSIEPSVDLRGAYSSVDNLAKKAFMVGDLRDGVEFRLWAYRLVTRALSVSHAHAARCCGAPCMAAAQCT